MRARAYITADAREQTAWGTARAYVAVGVATTDVGNALTPSILGFNRAFIQWAGITAGITQSFYDFYEVRCGLLPRLLAEFRYGRCRLVGVGLHGPARQRLVGDRSLPNSAGCRRLLASLAARPLAAPHLSSSTVGLLALPRLSLGPVPSALATAACKSPDIVGNIRLDQTWGSAQIMGAAHEVNADYYGPTP